MTIFSTLDKDSNLSTPVSIANGGTGSGTAQGGFDNLSPTTTKGDLIVRNATVNTRLGVGADGEVLTADAAEATGVKWAAPSGGGFNYPQSKYDSTGTYPFMGIAANSSIATNVAITSQRLYMTPITFGADLTLVELAIYVQAGAASSIARLGIYTSDSDGLPSTILVDGGTVSTATSTAVASVTISQAVTAGELYYSAITIDEMGGAVTVRGYAPCTSFCNASYQALAQFYEIGIDPASSLPSPPVPDGALQTTGPTLFMKI